MSDVKAKRGGRESVQREAVPPRLVAAPQPEALPDPAPVEVPAPAPVKAALTATAAPAAKASEDIFAYGRQAWAALAEAQAAAARGLEALATEMSALTRSEMAAATDSATAMLGVKTFSEAVEINLGYARRSFDALIASSAKLSEIGAKVTSEASRPILSRLGESWKAPRLE